VVEEDAKENLPSEDIGDTGIWTLNTKIKKCDAMSDEAARDHLAGWTKRGILRLSATVFDPIGLLVPFTTQARSLIQRLCSENLG
jgi:hypothetical protein